MHILDKLHWCVMETSFLQLAYGDGNLGWTSSADRYGNYTENVLVRVFFFFFLPGEQKATLQCKRKRSPHVSWTLQYTRLTCIHSGLLCQENFLSCAQ